MKEFPDEKYREYLGELSLDLTLNVKGQEKEEYLPPGKSHKAVLFLPADAAKDKDYQKKQHFF